MGWGRFIRLSPSSNSRPDPGERAPLSELEALWRYARRTLLVAGVVGTGLAVWLAVWQPRPEFHEHPWPAAVWVVALVVPALCVLALALSPRAVLLRALGFARILAWWMFAAALLAFVYNSHIILTWILAIAYSLAGLQVLSGVRRVRTADAASWGAEAPEGAPAPTVGVPGGLGETVATPFLGVARRPGPDEIPRGREMYPYAGTGSGTKAVMSYLYDAGDPGIPIRAASVQRDAETAPQLRRRARWWVLGGALFANVVAAFSAWGLVPLVLLGEPPRTDPSWSFLHLPLGGAFLVVPFLAAPFVAFFVGMSAATLGQEGSRRLAAWIGGAMTAMAAVCLVTGPWSGPLPLLAVAYLGGAIAYLNGVRLCRRADVAPGW